MRHLRRRGGIPIRTIAIALAILLAGCVSADQPVESAEIATDAAAPAAVASGTTNATASAMEAGIVPTAFPFAFEGRTSYSFCAPSGPNSCTGTPLPSESSNTFVPLEYAGTPTAIETTVTWTATTPATSEMYAYVFAARSCGDFCAEWTDDMFSVSASGPSPLVLSATDVKLAPDEALYFHVGTSDPTPPLPVFFFYSLEQPFSVEGTVTALVNATA